MATVWFEGLDEMNSLAVDLGDAGEKAQELAGVAIAKTASDIERNAKVIVPVDTGNLKNSISTSISEDGLTAEIGPTASYGMYPETGTARMAPAAYMGPSFDRYAPDLEKALAAIAASAI